MNFAGGVNGRPVALTVADDGSAVDTALAAFDQLVNESHVDAIIGPSSSEIAVDLIPRLARARTLVCSGSNSNGAISDLDSGGYYFRTAPPDRLQPRAMAELLGRDQRAHPLVIVPRDTYGLPLGRAIVREVRAAGARADLLTVTDPEGTAEVTARATAEGIDAVVLVGFPEATVPTLRALIAAGRGPNQFPVYGTDGLQNADLGALVDPAAPGVIVGMKGTTPAGVAGGIDHPFAARMFSAGVESFFSASTYDCAILVGLAAIAAGSDDAAEIKDHFAANLTGKARCRGFVECATLLASGTSIHYSGAWSTYEQWNRFEPGTGFYDTWAFGFDARPTVDPALAQLAVG